MNLDQYHKLKIKLEIFKFEKNYVTLNKVLYYFSFLGNIFLIYFGYFFVKSVTSGIPPLFPYQDKFFTVFIGLFLTGYELTKRFALEQMFTGIFQVGKATLAIVSGMLVCSLLVAGSFYLSIKGAHRLVDNSQVIVATADSTIQRNSDSVVKHYNKEIAYYRTQPGRTRQERYYRDSIVANLTQAREAKLQVIETKVQSKTQTEVSKSQENSLAFLFITIFLEFLILLGVGFNAYYTIGSFNETTKLLQTPKFKQLDLNLKLLKLYYQNGKKVENDSVLSYNKFRSLIEAQKMDCMQKDIKAFIILCQELDIVKSDKGRKKQFTIPYLEAKQIIEKQDIV